MKFLLKTLIALIFVSLIACEEPVEISDKDPLENYCEDEPGSDCSTYDD